MNIFVSYHPVEQHTISFLKVSLHDLFTNYKERFEKKKYKVFDIPKIYDGDKTNKNEYHNFFISFVKNNINYDEINLFFGFSPIGFDILFKNEFMEILNEKCYRIIWIEDLHAFYKKKTNIYNCNQDFNQFKDYRLDNADIIISPSPIFFKNLNINYKEKTVFLFYGIDTKNTYFDKIKSYEDRKNKILLSGNISQRTYPSRNYLKKKLQQTKNNFYKKYFELLEHPGYFNKGSCDENIIWYNYYDILQKYKVCFIGLARFPLNFLLAKIIETLVCGCLLLIEESPLLEKELGLINGVHYVGVPFHYKTEELIIDENLLQEIFEDKEKKYFTIALEGRRYVLENLNMNKNVDKILSICQYFKKNKLIKE